MDNCDDDLLDSILEAAAEANLELLPATSKQRYERQYDHFIQWARQKGTTNFKKEEDFLAYFLELSKVMRPNTLPMVPIFNDKSCYETKGKFRYWTIRKINYILKKNNL